MLSVKKDLLINTALTCGSIAAFFLLAEFGLRITGLQTVKPNPPQIYEQSENLKISYSLRKNLKDERAFRSKISTDEKGFRIHELGITNYELGKLVAVLGDSITFGYGVENNETLPAQLQALLPKYQFLNTAVPGYRLSQQVALYDESVRSLNPETIMVVFYWNDVDGQQIAKVDDIGILRAFDWQPGDTYCSPVSKGILQFVPAQCWLESKSAFYKAFKKLVNIRQGNRILEQDQLAASEGDIKDPADVDEVLKYINELKAFSDTLDSDQQKIFVIWPDRYVHNQTQPILIEGASYAGFDVIDLTDLFGNTAKTLGWDTVHPHPDTIKEAAEFIADQLES